MTESKKSITVRLDEDTKKMLDGLEKQYQMNQSEMIRDLIHRMNEAASTKQDGQFSERIRVKLNYLLYLISQIATDIPAEQYYLVEKLESELKDIGS